MIQINHQLLWKRFAGNELKFFFGNDKKTAVKVLVLKEVAAFIETTFPPGHSYVLDIHEGVSVYGLDMAMRFKKPAYETFKEVYLFVEKAGPDVALRALAREVKWCGISELTTDELNY
ncbi:MAG: hypothetical protein QM791_09740 [Ferruginibacter sp.]